MDSESGVARLNTSENAGEADDNTPKVDPLKWTVSIVNAFKTEK